MHVVSNFAFSWARVETTPAWPHLSTNILRRKAKNVLILIRIDNNSSSRFIDKLFKPKTNIYCYTGAYEITL